MISAKDITFDGPAGMTSCISLRIVLLVLLDPGDPLESQKASDILNPIFLCFLGVCLAIIFKIGDEKEAFRNIPWDIVFMICGLGMLIALAKEAGAIDKLSIYINSVSTDEHTIAYLLGISSSTMSIFSSTLGVVIPTFFPIIPNLNIDIALGLSIVVCFATFTGYSPFSTGGALVLAGTKDPKESKELFIGLLVLPAILRFRWICFAYHRIF